MKKLITIALGLIISVSANALELTDISLGVKHVGIPSGISTAYNGDFYDHSDKYQQSLGTINLSLHQPILETKENLVGVIAMISSGYHSEALQVQPYVTPKLYWVSRITQNLTFQISVDLPIVGGSISEKKWLDKDGFDFSYATAKPWSEYAGAKLHQPDTTTVGLSWSF